MYKLLCIEKLNFEEAVKVKVVKNGSNIIIPFREKIYFFF